jgi:hypothetical protein
LARTLSNPGKAIAQARWEISHEDEGRPGKHHQASVPSPAAAGRRGNKRSLQAIQLISKLATTGILFFGTGRRSVISYLLSPLRQYAHEGIRER